MSNFAKIMDLVRIPEHSDWIVVLLLGSIVLYIVMLQELQRGATLRDFVLQGMADRSNLFPSWLLVSLVHVVMLSALLSQFVPILPRSVERFSVFGWSLNKLGYTFWIIALFYLVKTVFSYLFYAFIGQLNRFKKLYFTASKFYFILTLILMVAVFVKFYVEADQFLFFNIILITAAATFSAKILFYLFHRSGVLPREWYYKILYICTLQFAPMLALWQLLFF